ncbi:unnamed protein product [Heterobilharzia americana]|nr:unnamed protein product [Heterobilharzia americana]
MHEILAPLLFVLHCDLVAFEHVQEMNLISSDLWYNLNYVMNREYFQADAYTMFAKVMNTIKHWYPQTKLLNTNNNNNNDNNNGGKLRRLTSIELPLKASMLKSEEYLKQSEDQAVNQVNKTTKLLNQIQKDISNDIKIKESNYFTIYYDHDQLEEDREQDDKYNRTDIRDTYKKQRQLNQQDYYQYMNHEEQEWNSFYFNETEHTTHNCSGYCFVEQIHKQLLLKHNAKLYKHLKHLDISPKLFGLRWVRLLFGHEFPLQDLLYIWDCIFAINNNLAFVPYIYLSMLLRLAPMLLKYEFSECLTLLMNYPAGIDVTYIVYLALHLYKPHLYDKPSDVYNHHVHNNDNTTATMTDDNNNNNQDIYSSNNNPDINSINHDDRNSNSEKIDNINNKNKGYDIFNSVLSLPSLSDKIKSKIKNTISVNRSISYHEAGSSNDFFSTSSSKFKQNKRSSMVNLLTLKKLEHLKTPNNNVQLLNKNENIFNHQKTNISCSSVNLSNAHNEEKFNKNYTDLYVSVPQLNNNNNTSSSSNTNNNFSIFDTISLSNSIDYGNKLFTNHYETESINDCEYYDMKVNNHSSTSTTAHTSLSSLSLNQISIMMKNSENDNSINSSIMEETIQPNLMDNFSKNATNSSSSMNIQDKNKRLHEKTYSLISNCIKSLSLCSTHMEIYLNNYVSQCLNKHHHDKYNGQDISSFPSLSPSSSFQFTPGYYTSYLPNQNSNCSSYYLQTFLPLSISSYSVHLYDYALFTNFDHLKYVQNEIKITLDNLIKFSYDHMDIPEELRHHKVNDESKHIDNNVEQSSLPLNSFYFTSH